MTTENIVFETPALLALALFAGCSDAGPPTPVAPVVVDGRIPVFAAAGPGPKYVLPTGKGLDVAFDPNPPVRR